jgi:hypothetical protein
MPSHINNRDAALDYLQHAVDVETSLSAVTHALLDVADAIREGHEQRPKVVVLEAHGKITQERWNALRASLEAAVR